MERITTIIPVFRESACLERLLQCLDSDRYPDKEVVVVVDEPTDETMRLVARFDGAMTFVINPKRRGKVYALNLAAERSSGEILFFLDADNVLPGNSTLSHIASGIAGRDIIEFQLDAMGSSFMARMVGLEFANANLANMFFSRYSAKKPIIGGAAFAIRKRAFYEIGRFRNFITEDLDLGWRAFEKNKSYRQLGHLKIYTTVPADFRSWFVQRERWSTGGAEWFAKNCRSIITGLLRNISSVTIPSFLVLFPMAVLGIINMVLPGSALEKIAIASLLLLPLKAPGSGPAVFFLFSVMAIVRDIASYGLGFVLSLSLTYAACRYTNRRFSLFEFSIYYFVYSPLTLFMFAYGLVRVVILRNRRLSNWKV